MSTPFTCPRPESTVLEHSPCDTRAGNCPIHKRCPDFDHCQRNGLECKAYYNYVYGRDPENMLMDRQYDLLPVGTPRRGKR